MNSLRIALLSPWFGGSHKSWAEGLCAASHHRIELFPLPARHWKWRMHGAAVTLARAVSGKASQFDLVLADDLLDVAAFRGLLAKDGVHLPIATYFHENQITYPVSDIDTDRLQGRDLHYGFINYTTALASDQVFFNSSYHRDVFLEALPGFLSRFPDNSPNDGISMIESKSSVLPLGMSLKELDIERPKSEHQNRVPLLLWNHRWEYDKQPEVFLQLVLDLADRDLEFEVALLGERGSRQPPVLERVRQRLGKRIVQDGPVPDRSAYARWLWKADIVPVTAIQDFLGGSVVEALYCQCHVLVPDRLAYPSYVQNADWVYTGYDQLLVRMIELIESQSWRQPGQGQPWAKAFDWSLMIEKYDATLAACCPNH